MRGQVSFFIIIGILAVIAVVAGLLIFSIPPPSSTPSQEHSPDFVSLRSCIDSEFTDTIILAGLNGGILEMSSEQRSKRAFFEPIQGYQFPLWNKDNNFYIPNRDNMQSQIKNELSNRISNRCLVEAGIDSRTTATVSVILSDRRNTAEISFDGDFVSENSRTSIPSMRIENDIPFISTFNTAKNMAEHLLLSGILIGMNHNIIELSPEIPTSGMDLTCETKKWRKSEVKNSFVQSLETYVPYIRFDNNPSVSGSSIAQKHFTFSTPQATGSNLIVRANYLSSFGLNFEAEKSQGDLMTSLVTKNPNTPNLCQNQYNFWYTMQYPLIFTIEDRSSSVPFQFRMALYNEVFRNQLNEPPEQIIASSGYCSETTYRRAQLNLQDDKTVPILNAFARINCGNEECVLRADSNGIINDYLPRRCIRGTVTFEKVGYKTVTTSYTSNAFDTFTGQDITMPKLRQIQLSFTDTSIDLSDFIFIIDSGRWITFDDDVALVPRDENNIEFMILKLLPDNTLDTFYGPKVLPNEDDLVLTIRSNFLRYGTTENSVDVGVMT